MSVTALRPKPAPNLSMVVALLHHGITDPRCGDATIVELEVVRSILDTEALIADLRHRAGRELEARMVAEPGTTLREMAEADENVRRLLWLIQSPSLLVEGA